MAKISPMIPRVSDAVLPMQIKLYKKAAIPAMTQATESKTTADEPNMAILIFIVAFIIALLFCYCHCLGD